MPSHVLCVCVCVDFLRLFIAPGSVVAVVFGTKLHISADWRVGVTTPQNAHIKAAQRIHGSIWTVLINKMKIISSDVAHRHLAANNDNYSVSNLENQRTMAKTTNSSKVNDGTQKTRYEQNQNDEEK